MEKETTIDFRRVSYWLDDDTEEIDQPDIDHIGTQLNEGYVEGELNHGEQEMRGYWKLIN